MLQSGFSVGVTVELKIPDAPVLARRLETWIQVPLRHWARVKEKNSGNISHLYFLRAFSDAISTMVPKDVLEGEVS